MRLKSQVPPIHREMICVRPVEWAALSQFGGFGEALRASESSFIRNQKERNDGRMATNNLFFFFFHDMRAVTTGRLRTPFWDCYHVGNATGNRECQFFELLSLRIN